MVESLASLPISFRKGQNVSGYNSFMYSVKTWENTNYNAAPHQMQLKITKGRRREN